MDKWDARMLELVEHVQEWSKDSTKVGALIVKDRDIISIGYNGFPRGVNEEDLTRHSRPTKYYFTEHAERNAIFNAARKGISTINCTMYIKWFPCTDCARAIIQSGITRLVCSKPDFANTTWGESFKYAEQMLNEANVELDYIKDEN